MAFHITRRILLVEDNPGDVRLFKAAIDDMQPPHELQVVNDAQEAIDLLFRRDDKHDATLPDLVVIDTHLFGTSGLDVVRQLKADNDLMLLPVVVFSGSDTDAARAYRCQANSYVKKPSDIDEYFDAVRTIVKFWCELAELPK